MKYRCLQDLFLDENPNERVFTKGKTYKAENNSEDWVRFTNDLGDPHTCSTWMRHFREVESEPQYMCLNDLASFYVLIERLKDSGLRFDGSFPTTRGKIHIVINDAESYFKVCTKKEYEDGINDL